jgi:hypothetical protein
MPGYTNRALTFCPRIINFYSWFRYSAIGRFFKVLSGDDFLSGSRGVVVRGVGVGNVGKGYFVHLLFASEPICFFVGRFLSFLLFAVTSKYVCTNSNPGNLDSVLATD